MRLIKKGKVKDVYEYDNERLVFHFTDRISAFDIIMNNSIPYKGKVLCDFAIFWFSTLKTSNHFLKKMGMDKIMVKKLSMIPIECIVRDYMYGSLYTRFEDRDYNNIPKDLLFNHKDNIPQFGSRLPITTFDPSTKSDEHDLPIDEYTAISKNLINKDEFYMIKSLSLDLFSQMGDIIKKANFILADVKFEFGMDKISNRIYLADSIGPDECRLWDANTYQPGRLQDSFDKQILRDWLSKTGYVDIIKEYAKRGKKPNPPSLPDDIVHKISERYIEVYEKITNTEFKKM